MLLNIQQTTGQPYLAENDQPKASSVRRLRSPRLSPRGGSGADTGVKGSPLLGCFLRSELTSLSWKAVVAQEGAPRGPPPAGGFTRPPHPFLGSQGLWPFPWAACAHSPLRLQL